MTGLLARHLDPDPPDTFYGGRKWTFAVTAAAAVLLAVIGAAIIIGHRNHRTAPATPTVTAAPTAGVAGPAAASPLTAAPTVARWTDYHGALIPVRSPRTADNTPTGAVLDGITGILTLGRGTAAEQLATLQRYATGPGAAEIRRAVPVAQPAGAAPQAAGFRQLTYTPPTSIVDVALLRLDPTSGARIYQSTELNLRWSNSGWQIVFDRNSGVAPTVLNDLTGYVKFGSA
jgi:hypothetical protein